jgi:uncharacterized protein (TIGR00369 family)
VPDPSLCERSFTARISRDLDIRLDKVSEGVCETSLVIQERLLQQHGFIHGGVIATMADHTAGGAARSVSGDKGVLTVEFKINYLRPAIGDRLRCTASVLRGGKTVIVAEALVYASNAGKETLVAKLIETLFLADDPKARTGSSQALLRSSNSSGVRGQSWRSRRLRERSANSFPAVWQCGQ